MSADFEDVATTGCLVGYARVSTDDQNLDLQRDALLKYGVLPDNSHSDTASGAKRERPGFIAAMKDLREGDTLVVWRLDRLGRDLSQLVHTAERLRERNIELVILQDRIDTKTPLGRFMFGVMGSFAQLEREMIVERTKAGLLAARLRGRVGGRKAILLPAHFEKVDAFVADGMTPRAAAKKARISPSSYYRYLKEKTRERE